MHRLSMNGPTKRGKEKSPSPFTGLLTIFDREPHSDRLVFDREPHSEPTREPHSDREPTLL
jgi:hypothetical protein